jgi:LysW-gamma-L-lysine carboxypeptidase
MDLAAAVADPASHVGPDHRPEVVLLQEMVDIASVSGEEGPLGQYLVAEMTALGYRARLDRVGNAIGEIGPDDAPTIVLLGHMDTVAGEVAVRRDGPLLYGRGTVDAKGPLATMICAGARMGRPSGVRIVVVGAVEEERDSIGARHLVTQYRPDAVVVGEPSGVSSVVIGYKGVLRLACEIHRPPTHSSSAQPKAIEDAVELWNSIRGRLAPDPRRALFAQVMPTLVRLDGDMQRAELMVSCRTPVGFDADSLLTWIRESIGEDHLVVLEWTAAVCRPRTDPVARALSAAIRRHGGDPTTKVKLGTADMNIVAEAWPVPTATYGPGDSRLDHAENEHIDIRDYLLAIDVLADALGEIATDIGVKEMTG